MKWVRIIDKRFHVLMVIQVLFQHGWLGAARRVVHVAEAFKSLGVEVAILTGRATNPEIQQELDRVFPGAVMRTTHSGDYPGLLEGSHFLRRAWRASRKLLGQSNYWSSRSWGWANRLDLTDIARMLLLHNVRPNLVWGICTGDLAGAVAAERIAQLFNVPHVIELHDPPDGAGVGPNIPQVQKRFDAQLRAADRVIVTTETYGQKLQEDYHLRAEQLRSIHLTYDQREQGVAPNFGLGPESGGSQCFSLSYAGSLSGKRSLIPLARAVVVMFDRWPEMKDTFVVRLVGGGAGYQELQRFVRRHGLAANFHLGGPLSGDEVGKFLYSSSAVVVTQPRAYGLQVPGKIFESLILGKPIVGLMPLEIEAANIIRKSGLGFIHEPEDHYGTASTLKFLWDSWLDGTVPVRPNWEYISEFSVEHMPFKLANALRGIVNLDESG